MKKVDEKILRALCNLEDNPDFRVVREWFLESAAEQDKILRSSESAVLVYRAQGASSNLLEVCEISATPRDIVARMLKQKAGINIPD